MRSPEVDEYTLEAEFTSADRLIKGGLGSDIDGVGTAPVLDGDTIGTEGVLESESLGFKVEHNIDLNRCGNLGGDTMQFDYETNAHESDERIQTTCLDTSTHSRSNKPLEHQKSMEDTEAGGTIRTAALLASEVLGSWAYSIAPSVNGGNESPKIGDNNEDRAMALHDSSGMVAQSKSTPSSEAAATSRDCERQALSEMIGIVAPDLKEQFGDIDDGDFDQRRKKRQYAYDSDSEDCIDSDCDNDKVAAKSGSISDAETEGSDLVDKVQKLNDVMDEDDETTCEDSLG